MTDLQGILISPSNHNASNRAQVKYMKWPTDKLCAWQVNNEIGPLQQSRLIKSQKCLFNIQI